MTRTVLEARQLFLLGGGEGRQTILAALQTSRTRRDAMYVNT